MKFKFLTATFVGLMLTVNVANAGLIWETAPIDGGTEVRAANSNFVTVFNVAQDINLTNIAQETDLVGNGSMNFFIFNGLTGSLLFETGSTAFIDDGFNFNKSSDFLFQLVAGNTYTIGAVANVSAVYGRQFNTPVSMNGITSTSGNQNVSGFLNPSLSLSTNCCDARIQLFGDVAEVPEPTTLAIFAIGLIGLASRRFKKQS